MSEKLLTLIIPSYNMEALLPKCLGSLVGEEMNGDWRQGLEVLVVNDGSKDRTSEIAHDFELRYQEVVKVIDKPNGHYGSCVNAGLKAASGVWVKMLDADDYFDSAVLAEYMGLLQELYEKGETPDLVLTEFQSEDPEGKVRKYYGKWGYPVGRTFDMEEFNRHHFDLFMHSLTYRTEMLRAIDYRQFEGIMYTDLQWAFKPMAAVGSARYFPKVLYHYLVGREGQSVDPKVHAKTIWMRKKILMAAAQDYAGLCASVPAANQTYLKYWMDVCFLNLYNACIFENPCDESDKDLAEVDELLKTAAPEIYEKLGELEISRRLRFRYVRAWRRSKSSRSLAFRLFNAYQRLVGMIRRVR